MLPVSKAVKKKNPIWNLYFVLNDSKAKCKICEEVISTAGRCTTGINRHAERFHFAELKTVKEEDAKKSNSDFNITKLLALALATSGISFNFMDNAYFREYLSKTGCPIISGGTMKKTMFELAEQSRHVIEGQLKGIRDIVVVLDGWSSRCSNYHVYALFLVYVTKQFERVTTFIGCKSVKGEASSENVARILSELLTSVRVDISSVCGMISDEGTNLVKLAKTLNLPRTSCICHFIANFYKDVMTDNLLKDVLSKATRTAGVLCRSTKTREKFYASIAELISWVPSIEEKSLGEKAVDMLAEIFPILTLLEGDNSSASSIIPNLIALTNFLNQHQFADTNIGKLIRRKWRRRTEELLTNPDLILATYCDARFSHFNGVLGKTSWESVEKAFVAKYGKKAVNDMGKSNVDEPSQKKPKLSPLATLMSLPDSTEDLSLKKEMDKFKVQLSVSRPDINSDPLYFWRANSISFPILSMIARELLCMPSSSASVERLFSRASGLVSNVRRNRMLPDTVDTLLQVGARAKLIRENSKIFQIDENPDRSDSEYEEDSDEFEEIDQDQPTSSSTFAVSSRQKSLHEKTLCSEENKERSQDPILMSDGEDNFAKGDHGEEDPK